MAILSNPAVLLLRQRVVFCERLEKSELEKPDCGWRVAGKKFCLIYFGEQF